MRTPPSSSLQESVHTKYSLFGSGIFSMGACVKRFFIMIDYSGLRYLFDQPKLNVRKSRWMALNSEFDFEIKHIKGKEKQVIDSLSRSMHN